MPGDLLDSPVHRLPHLANGLHPAKIFFDPLPDFLAETIVRLMGGSAVYGQFPVAGFLCHMRGDVETSHLYDKGCGVVAFVTTQGDAPACARQLPHHGLCQD